MVKGRIGPKEPLRAPLENPPTVELPRACRDGHGHRPLCCEGRLESSGIVHRILHVPSGLHSRGIGGASLVSPLVRNVRLQRDARGHSQVEGKLHGGTLAPSSPTAAVRVLDAIDISLRRQLKQLTTCNLIVRFDALRGTKCPAGAATPLIFYGRHCTLRPPVERGWVCFQAR